MADFCITVELDAGAGRDPSLEDFQRELQALTSTLLSADDLAAPGVRLTEYVVKDLHHSTPTIVLEARPVRPELDFREQILAALLDGVNCLTASGRVPVEFTAETIDYLRGLSAPIGNGMKETVIRWRDRTAVIGLELKDKLKRIRLQDDVEDGEIDGHLEQINIHGEKPNFRVYPLVGPEFITCDYADDLRETVKEALGKYVVVEGQMRYKRGARYPYRVKARSIQVLDEGSQPSLLEIGGIATDATAGDSTVDFLQRIRDGW